jgi:hypothetical protein
VVVLACHGSRSLCTVPSKAQPHRVRQSHCSILRLHTISNVGTKPDSKTGKLSRPTGMQRFKTGDPIIILPRFAHLYPTSSGVVMNVKPDPFRPMFNEYTIKLDDGSTASVFEFQLIEDGLKYQNFIASLVFDSHQQSGAAQVRGQAADRHIILQTQSMDIDMKIRPAQNQSSIIGQILERSSPRLAAQAEVSLLKDNVALMATVADSTGTFKFSAVPRGPLNIQVVIRANLWRILGMFSI